MNEDIYSKRHKKEPVSLNYEFISEKLKIQIIRTWKFFFNQFEEEIDEKFWFEINNKICDVHGKHTLFDDILDQKKNRYSCEFYFENLDSLKEEFDVIEIVFRAIIKIPEIIRGKVFVSPEKIIKELNERFYENDFGYEFINERIVRVDNKLLHKDVINKVIKLTKENIFENANEEFLSALDHLRNRKNKEALNDSLKAFESTMKIIINDLNWDYKEDDTAQKLIKKCLSNDLIPSFLQSQFSAVRATLESGIPTIRNKKSGHGQGPIKISVPNSLASYSIYMTGVCMNYLIELYNEKKSSN